MCQGCFGEKKTRRFLITTTWLCRGLEKRFKNDPEIKERYAKSIQDVIEKGYVRKLSEEEACTNGKVTWYLPHRFVINPKKPDRIRRVYDASAKFRGQSLNKITNRPRIGRYVGCSRRCI